MTEQSIPEPATEVPAPPPMPSGVTPTNVGGVVDELRRMAEQAAQSIRMTALHHAGQIVATAAAWEQRAAETLTADTLKAAAAFEAYIKGQGAEATPIDDSNKS